MNTSFSPFRTLLLVAFLLAAFTLFFSKERLESLLGPVPKDISISEMTNLYSSDQLLDITVQDNTITATDVNNTIYTATKEPQATLQELGLYDSTKATKVNITDTSNKNIWLNVLLSILPFALLIGFFVFMSRRANSVMGGNDSPFGFGKSKAKVYDKAKHSTKFSDMAGADEAKEDVFEIVDFLKYPEKYDRMGAKIPKGILLVGPPGTGKTLLARAIAGEADVPFFSVSGSEFVEMFVGVGAARVRDLFKNAKRNAPSIIFIDEIDAIGKKRGQGMGGGHDEREQTLNQILTEMDGFEKGTTVIVIAATNRPDVLDKALLRPGRFDRRVHIDMPEMHARRKILDIHSRNKVFDSGIDMDKIASKTVGFSGADLENVMNEAAIRAVKNRRQAIIQEDIEDAVEKVSMGPERKSRRITDKEKRIIAYHEVGHAIAGHLTKNDPVHKISIISRGQALGLTWFLPEEDTYLQSESQMRDKMVSLQGGRMAERMMFGETTTGASNDLERISAIARAMVMTYGMGGNELGPVVYTPKSKSPMDEYTSSESVSEATESIIDARVRELVVDSEERCKKLLEDNKQLLERISEDLLVKENIYRDEFLAYFDSK